MKIVIYILTFIHLVSISADEYIHFNDYLSKNSDQIKVINDFKELIQTKSEVLSIKQKKRVKIVLIYPEDQVSDYWRRNITALKKRLMETNVSYKLELIPTPTSGNTKKESKRIIRAIKEKPDYLIFTLNVKENSKLINQILSYSSIKVILLNITTPLKLWKDNHPLMYVGFDHEVGTQKMIDEIKKRLPDGGDFLVLYHSKGYVSKMRGDYAIKRLLKDKKWNLVSRYYTDGKKNKVKIALKDFFKNHSKVDLIISCSTDISLEAQNFKTNSNKFLLNGWGGGSAEIESIKNKDSGIDFTVMRMNDDSAIAIAEAIKLDIQGESNKIPQIFSGEMILIDKDISPTKLKNLEDKAFRYSNEIK